MHEVSIPCPGADLVKILKWGGGGGGGGVMDRLQLTIYLAVYVHYNIGTMCVEHYWSFIACHW